MNAQQEVERLLAQIRDRVNHDPVIERASDQIEMLCRGYMAPTEDFLPEIHFTPGERKILNLLRRRLGSTIAKGALLDACTYASHDDPHPKMLDVLICRIRRKMLQARAAYHIETDHSIGFRLVDGAQSDNPARGKSNKFLMQTVSAAA